MTLDIDCPRVIAKFSGQWNYLSNFYQTPVVIRGITYPSGEHAFQAAKTDDITTKQRIAAAHSSHQAKALGRSVPLVSGWNEWRRYDAMERVIAAKFKPGGELRNRLLATGDAVLIEGNTWHDNTWGICSCGRCTGGHNLLGWMLMRQRARGLNL
jgi:hypothetical protein